MDRFVKIYERILDWEWSDDPNMVALWVHLLFMANYKDKKWHGIDIKRGQFVTTLNSLSVRTGISIRSLRTCLGRLKTTGEIEEQATNKFRIITVCKYEDYQSFENCSDKQTTNKRQTTDKQTTTTLDKIDKIDKKKRTTEVVPKEKFCIAPEFEVAFNTWVEYKRQRKQSYKSEMSLKMCYNKLLKLSNGDPITAALIVEQSIANNWAGLFALKDNGTKTNNGNYQLLENGVQAINELAAEGGTPKEVPF